MSEVPLYRKASMPTRGIAAPVISGAMRATLSPEVDAFETGTYLRHIDSCITQLKAQGPSRTCNESKQEEEDI